MKNKVKPVPEGFHSVAPCLTPKDSLKAIEFYEKAFNKLQQTWNRPDALDYANIFGEHIITNYRLLMESRKKGQDAASKELHLRVSPVVLRWKNKKLAWPLVLVWSPRQIIKLVWLYLLRQIQV